MLYRFSHRGKEFVTASEGVANPRWMYESFALEEDVREKWWHPQQGEYVIDAGAGFGSYTLPALAHGASVVAVEPNKEALYSLCLSAAVNRFANLTALPFVLGQYPGNLATGYDAGCCRSAGLGNEPQEHRVSDTVDQLCEGYKLPRLDWLKIDVEGGEIEVLKGAVRALTACRPRLLVECHDGILIDASKKVAAAMESLGYRGEWLQGQGVNDRWSLWRPA